MTAQPVYLTPIEHDFLCEMFNLGVGSAASSLSKMVNQQVLLSVPIVELKTRQEMAGELGVGVPICSVSQSMNGPFSAQSMLLFPADSGLKVVRAMLNTHVSDEMLAELQHEALSEIGNVVLNACIGSMANTITNSFKVGLPTFEQSTPEILLEVENKLDDVVLLIRIFMTLSESKVTGYLAFVLGNISLKELRQNLNYLISEIERNTESLG
jgi:chemotaxis protein CheC